MPISVIFPKVSLEAASGRIARWCVAEGDAVAVGQVLFEIDNDKAAVEVEAPGAGVIRRLADADVEVAVGAEVARIVAIDDVEVVATPMAASAEAASTVAGPDAAPAPPRWRRSPNPTPLARRIAREQGIRLAGMAGTGPHGRVQKKDVLAELAALATSASAAAPTLNAKALLHFAWLRQGHGMPVVMLHGFGGELGAMRGILSGGYGDWPALALDLPCHGQSPRTTPHDLDAIAEMVEATLDAQRVGPIVLAGHSFGGAVAVRLAHRAQMEVRGLCLFAPAGLGPEINGPFIEGMLRARSEESLRPWLEQLVHDLTDIPDAFVRAVAQQRRDEALTAAMQAFARRFYPDGTQAFSIRADLAGLSHLVRPISNIRRWPCASSTRSGAVPEDELRPASSPGPAAGCRRSRACPA
jgi:pyruvate dehydrogenase E2 component (dihydrolipoamide acetyltransferase)